MTHRMRLHPHSFASIASGAKTFELRLYDEKRKIIQVGDTIVFFNFENASEQLCVLVKQLYVCSSFEELYNLLPLDKCGYLPNELQTASPSDMEQYYPAEKQKQYGVLGIEIELEGDPYATVSLVSVRNLGACRDPHGV